MYMYMRTYILAHALAYTHTNIFGENGLDCNVAAAVAFFSLQKYKSGFTFRTQMFRLLI